MVKLIIEDFDNEDYGFGFTSNGEALTESDVEALYEIAEGILNRSKLAKFDTYVTIAEDAFKYYASSPYVGEEFMIYFDFEETGEWFWKHNYLDFSSRRIGWSASKHYKIETKIYVKDGEVVDVDVEEPRHSDAVTNLYKDAFAKYIKDLASPVARDIYYGTTNI